MPCTEQTWMTWASAFELLSKAFLLPSRETAEALVEGAFSDACCEVLAQAGCSVAPGAGLAAAFAPYAGRDAGEVLTELRCEYTRLFVGVRDPLVTPYLGVWASERRGRRGLLFLGEESRAVEAFMHRCGVAKGLGAGRSNDPLDHLGTMCEFLMILCLVEARAVLPPEGHCVEPGSCGAFFGEYFREFALDVAPRVAELAACPFYQAMAVVLGTVASSFPFGEAAAG